MEDAAIVGLAPLNELIDLIPKIKKAKEHARLGAALQKVTTLVDQLASVPNALEGLVPLLEATDTDFESLRTEISISLKEILKVGQLLGGEPTIEQLDEVNQIGQARLANEFKRIVGGVEAVWRKAVKESLGGQSALGQVLSRIPEVKVLGQALLELAKRAELLEDGDLPASYRIQERDALLQEASKLNERLLSAGIAPAIAQFLVSVANQPVRLSGLSDEILGWIRDNGALALFTVSVRGAT